jgi:putative transposase
MNASSEFWRWKVNQSIPGFRVLIGPGIFIPIKMLVFDQFWPELEEDLDAEEAVYCGALLKQAQVGVPVAEVIRKAGISEQTFYRWKAKYAGLEVNEVRKMAQLQEENLRLKQLVAELTLDKTMLQDVLSKKWWSLRGVDRWWSGWLEATW